VSSEGAVLEAKLNPKSGSDNADLILLLEQLLNQRLPPFTEVSYGSAPPLDPKDGDLWYNIDENRLYAYVA